VNILFINYGGFRTNSTNHIVPWANKLIDAGHDCVVAVPTECERLAEISPVQFRALEFDELDALTFRDGRGIDIMHAWTPREVVRRFVILCKKRYPEARVIIHLEDHEGYLTRTYSGKEEADLELRRLDSYNPAIPKDLSHPLRSRFLLAIADGVSLIYRGLDEMVPAFLPRKTLLPPVDLEQFRPDLATETEFKQLGLAEGSQVIAYTGNTTFANLEDLRVLYDAVAALRQKGRPVVLVKTGYQMEALAAHPLCQDPDGYRDLGFIEKSRIPVLLAMSAVLVQPGRPGLFNDFRLPSKLPEFLASGRPVITLSSNIGHDLSDGENALLYHKGTSEEILSLIERVLDHPELAKKLEAGARAFASRFQAAVEASTLIALYEEALQRAPHGIWEAICQRAGATEISAWIAGKDDHALKQEIADLYEQSLEVLSEDAFLLSEENLRLAREKYDADVQVHERNVALHALSKEKATIEAERNALQQSLQVEQNKAQILERRIARMKMSKSWKLTRPLRKMQQWFSKEKEDE